MKKNYLNPKQPAGVPPYADYNVETVGPTCLDVNTKWAFLARGKGRGVWWLIFMMVFFPILVFLITVDHFTTYSGSGNQTHFIDAFFGFVRHSILVDIVVGLMLGYGVYIWRTHLPLRFNRNKRMVYYHRKGQTYTSDWDNIRAYLHMQPYRSSGIKRYDPQVNIEFLRENGTILTVPLLATTIVDNIQDAAAFWEYIRLYMEEGPDRLPKLEKDLEHKDFPECWKENDFYETFLGDFKFGSFWWFFFAPIFLPIIALSYPTNCLYYRLVKRIKVAPFPPDMVDACLSKETRKERQEKRLADIRSHIERNMQRIHSLEQTLRKTYEAWFVEFRFSGYEQKKVIDGLPEGWYRVPLGDLVELNPNPNTQADQECWYLPVSALPESGMYIERNHLKKSTQPSTTLFHNGDSLIPRISPWLENGHTGFVDFLVGDEIACCSTDILVMRGRRVSPEFTYCLATNRLLREQIARSTGDDTDSQSTVLNALSTFSLAMPPLGLLDEFVDKHAKPSFREINQLVAENINLKQTRERILSTLATLTDEPSPTNERSK